MLEYLGVQTDITNNGQEAINCLSEQHYDLIFMDCHMPVLDGYQATKKIREMKFANNSSKIPIIAIKNKLALIQILLFIYIYI